MHYAIGARSGQSKGPSGIIRVAALSSVIRAAPGGHVEVFSRELRELPYMLKSGEADFIMHDNPKVSGDFSAVELGHENLVHNKKQIRAQ